MDIKVNLNIFIFVAIFYLTGQINIYGILMLFALIHELGHLLSGICLGFKPKALSIMPFGLSVSFETFPKDYNVKVKKGNQITVKKLLIALAGPLTNFIIAFLFLFIHQEVFGMQREIIVYCNILIGTFNLLPIYPLDGGRILKCILNLLFGLKDSIIHTNRIANITMILLTMIASIAIYYYQNIAILFIIVYLWGLMIVQNKRFTSKMKLYKLIEKTMA